MFDNLVTYHVHKQNPLPDNDSLAYQYILAGNGIFIRAETIFFDVLLPIAPCSMRGLTSLVDHFRLKVPYIPVCLLNTVLTNALRSRRTDGGLPDNGLNEVLYYFHHYGQMVRVKKPAQRVTAISVSAAGDDDPTIICDLHSHGNMPAFFSQTDNADEQAAKLYAVMGNLDTVPEMRLRVGIYGYWMSLPITAVFNGNNSFKDLYQEKQS